MSTRRSSRRRKDVAQAAQGRLAMIDTELDRKLALIEATRRSLLAAEAALTPILRDSIDPDEQQQAGLELLRVTRELALLEQRERALEAGAVATLSAPSDDDIAEAQRIAAALARVISGNRKVAAVAGLLGDAIRLVERLAA